MPPSRPRRLNRKTLCGIRPAAAGLILLAAPPAVASDAVLAPLLGMDAIGQRLAKAREPTPEPTSKSTSPEGANTVRASYAQGSERITEAAIEAVPGVALAFRPQASASPKAETRAWGVGTGFTSRTGADARGPSLRSGGAGFTLGVDRLLDPTLLAGVALGFSRTETSSVGLRRELETFSGSAYASWSPFDGWELDGLLGNTWVEMDSARLVNLRGTVAPTSGRSKGPGVGAAASAGYRFRATTSFGEAFAKPFATLSHASQNRRGYVESGAFGPGLAFPSERFERTTLNLGVATGIEVSAGEDWTLRPELRLAWSRYLSDPSPQVPAFLFGTPVLVGEPDPGRDGALVSVEVAGWKRRELQAFAGYAGEFRSNSTVHQGHGGVRLSW